MSVTPEQIKIIKGMMSHLKNVVDMVIPHESEFAQKQFDALTVLLAIAERDERDLQGTLRMTRHTLLAFKSSRDNNRPFSKTEWGIVDTLIGDIEKLMKPEEK
jgi:hypothetical protein